MHIHMETCKVMTYDVHVSVHEKHLITGPRVRMNTYAFIDQTFVDCISRRCCVMHIKYLHPRGKVFQISTFNRFPRLVAHSHTHPDFSASSDVL